MSSISGQLTFLSCFSLAFINCFRKGNIERRKTVNRKERRTKQSSYNWKKIIEIMLFADYLGIQHQQ